VTVLVDDDAGVASPAGVARGDHQAVRGPDDAGGRSSPPAFHPHDRGGDPGDRGREGIVELNAILTKLDADTRTEAVVVAARQGILML